MFLLRAHEKKECGEDNNYNGELFNNTHLCVGDLRYSEEGGVDEGMGCINDINRRGQLIRGRVVVLLLMLLFGCKLLSISSLHSFLPHVFLGD